MPAASTTRQPDNPLAWFDGAEGRALLADAFGLLRPLLQRLPGQRACHILPTEHGTTALPLITMPQETRLWCDPQGWHGDFGTLPDGPPRSLHGMDLVVAAHVIGSFPGVGTRLQVIHRLLAPGGSAFIIEFNPWSPWRRHWRKAGLDAISLRRLVALSRQAGFNPGASYAVRPRTSDDSTGLLLRHNWRLPSWLPLRAYAIRLRKSEPGMTLVGASSPAFPLGAPNA